MKIEQRKYAWFTFQTKGVNSLLGLCDLFAVSGQSGPSHTVRRVRKCAPGAVYAAGQQEVHRHQALDRSGR